MENVIITFNQFAKDFKQYYQCKISDVRMTYSDLEETIYELYATGKFEEDYDKETIELFY